MWRRAFSLSSWKRLVGGCQEGHEVMVPELFNHLTRIIVLAIICVCINSHDNGCCKGQPRGSCCLMHLVKVGGGNELMKFVVDPNMSQLAEAAEACEKLQMELTFSGSPRQGWQLKFNLNIFKVRHVE